MRRRPLPTVSQARRESTACAATATLADIGPTLRIAPEFERDGTRTDVFAVSCRTVAALQRERCDAGQTASELEEQGALGMQRRGLHAVGGELSSGEFHAGREPASAAPGLDPIARRGYGGVRRDRSRHRRVRVAGAAEASDWEPWRVARRPRFPPIGQLRTRRARCTQGRCRIERHSPEWSNLRCSLCRAMTARSAIRSSSVSLVTFHSTPRWPNIAVAARNESDCVRPVVCARVGPMWAPMSSGGINMDAPRWMV